MSLLSNVVVPVAAEGDASDTADALAALEEELGRATLVYVVEKAGGAVDKAGVEQREAAAREAFEAFDAALPGVEADHRVVYDTDVVGGILGLARELDASAVVFTPREGGRLVRLLTGDVALRLVTDADRPVVSLPDPNGGEGEE